MPVTHLPYRRAYRFGPPLVSIIAANTPQDILRGPGQAASGAAIAVGGCTMVIKKINVFNANAASAIISLGQDIGAGFVRVLADFLVLGGQEYTKTEDELPEIDFTNPIRVQSTVGAAAPNDVRITIEVDIFAAGNAPA